MRPSKRRRVVDTVTHHGDHSPPLPLFRNDPSLVFGLHLGEHAVDPELPCDGFRGVVIVGIGVEPATPWLDGSGIELQDGVVVDARGETNVPGVFAAGDVANTFSAVFGTHLRIEQYGNAHLQGALVGRNMAGADEAHVAIPSTSSEQFGARLQFVGRATGYESSVMRGNPADYTFTALFLKSNVVVAAFAMNRARDFAGARKLVSSHAPVEPVRLRDEAVPL